MQCVLRLIGIVVILALFAPTASAQQAARSYLLLGKSDKLPANLEQVVAEKGGIVAYTVPEIGLAVLTSANPDFQAQMAGVVEVESVIPDIQVNFYLPGFQPLGTPPSSGHPFDFAEYQWNLDAIDAPEAWARGALGTGVRIAILDDGIYAEHPDLAPNLNLALSKSFIPGNPEPFTATNFPSHASHVTGIAAAADNGIGIIGVAPEAEIVGVRVLNWEVRFEEIDGVLTPYWVPVGTFADLAAGIVYAANIDSDIINISLGGWVDKNGYCDENGVCLSKKDTKELMKLLDRATRYAHKKGALVIAAAGNDATDTDSNGKNYFLPAQSDKVIAVSATGPVNWITYPDTDLDVFAPYSNYGKSIVDFAAPGGNPTLAFLDPECLAPFPLFGVLACHYFDNIWGPSSVAEFPWTLASGTSAAVPHVSGVAALVIGKNGGQMDPDKVEKALKKGADDLGTRGKDPYYGNGRVNAVGSLNALARREMDIETEDSASEVNRCASTEWECATAGKNVLFLSLISSR